jgi:aspartate/methionine/tyrosine aminotransferase
MEWTKEPFYVQYRSGRPVPVETDQDFLPEAGRIAKAITPRTKAVVVTC